MSSSAPLIGITGNLGEAGCQLASAYFDSVRRAGGIPVVLPPMEWDETEAAHVLDRVDALLLSGGGDINPLVLGRSPYLRCMVCAHSVTHMSWHLCVWLQGGACPYWVYAAVHR